MSAFKDLLQQAEVLLRQATNGSQGQADDLRQNAQDLLEKVKASSQVLQDEAVGKAKQVGEATQNYVKENPWQAVGIAASLGLMLGALQKTKRRLNDINHIIEAIFLPLFFCAIVCNGMSVACI